MMTEKNVLCLDIAIIYFLYTIICYYILLLFSLTEPPSNVSNASEKKTLKLCRFLLTVLHITRNHSDAHLQEHAGHGTDTIGGPSKRKNIGA